MRSAFQKRATRQRRPLHLQRIKDQQTSYLFAVGKVPRSPNPSIYYVAINASSNVLEASISAQHDAKECDVASSPSPLIISKRLANTYFWKHSLQHSKWRGYENGGTLPTANKYLFADLLILRAGSAMKQRRPLLPHATRQLRLPAHHWKCSLQLCCPQVTLQKRSLF